MLVLGEEGRYEFKVTSYNEDSNTWGGILKESKEPKKEKFGWNYLRLYSELADDASYLVSWKKKNGTFSHPIHAYWNPDEECFMSVDSSIGFPLDVDVYMLIKDPNDEFNLKMAD